MIEDLTGGNITSRDDAGQDNVRQLNTRHDTLQDTWQMSCWDMIEDLTGGNITSRGETMLVKTIFVESMLGTILGMILGKCPVGT